MLRKLKEEMRLKHPPYPPSKEGGILAVFPLSKGGPRGIIPSILPLGEGGLRGIVPKDFTSLIETHDVKEERYGGMCKEEGMKRMSHFNGLGNL